MKGFRLRVVTKDILKKAGMINKEVAKHRRQNPGRNRQRSQRKSQLAKELTQIILCKKWSDGKVPKMPTLTVVYDKLEEDGDAKWQETKKNQVKFKILHWQE